MEESAVKASQVRFYIYIYAAQIAIKAIIISTDISSAA